MRLSLAKHFAEFLSVADYSLSQVKRVHRAAVSFVRSLIDKPFLLALASFFSPFFFFLYFLLPPFFFLLFSQLFTDLP